MKKLLSATLCSLSFALAPQVFAQSAGTAPGANTAQSGDATADPNSPAIDNKETVRGISVKDDVMGKTVRNEDDDKVGDIRDVVMDDDHQATHYVIGAGGFLGMGEHNVAISIDEVQRDDDHFILRGYTKDELKDLPGVEVSE
ncbi:MAG TPA: PRC-barrel domain-containing protein [Burkholderiaceae bacterium]|nr:PRC-barrel domain-containing protein [Burkholderiaceae bacterium]